VVAGDAEADLAVRLEPAGWCEKTERRGSERVGGREDYAAVVEAGVVGGGGGRAAEGEVPFEEIAVEGSGVVVRGGVGGEFGGFFYCGRRAQWIN